MVDKASLLTSTLSDHWWARADFKRLPPEYTGHVWQHTSKDLQYDQDALAAFRGIIAAGAIATVWGLPLQDDDRWYTPSRVVANTLAVALTWVPDVESSGMGFREIRRRRGSQRGHG